MHDKQESWPRAALAWRALVIMIAVIGADGCSGSKRSAHTAVTAAGDGAPARQPEPAGSCAVLPAPAIPAEAMPNALGEAMRACVRALDSAPPASELPNLARRLEGPCAIDTYLHGEREPRLLARATLRYQDNGRVVHEQRDEDLDGRPDIMITYHHDERGHLIREHRTSADHVDCPMERTAVFHIDISGRPLITEISARTCEGVDSGTRELVHEYSEPAGAVRVYTHERDARTGEIELYSRYPAATAAAGERAYSIRCASGATLCTCSRRVVDCHGNVLAIWEHDTGALIEQRYRYTCPS